MRWQPRPPKDRQAWYWAFALIPHICERCDCRFWLEWCGKRRLGPLSDALSTFACNRCFVLATARAALPAP